MKRKAFIGVDPGGDGAVAITLDGEIFIGDYVRKKEIYDKIKELQARGIEMHAVLEKVGAMPKQGRTSVFKFGERSGGWKDVFEYAGIPYDLITPQKWQKEMYDFKPTQGRMSDNEWKRYKKTHSRNRAKILYPSQSEMLQRVKDHNRSDALLMMGYCERKYGSVVKTEEVDHSWMEI